MFRGRQDRPPDELRALQDRLDEIAETTRQIDKRLRDTQKLAMRAIEQNEDWPGLLRQVRASSSYARAFDSNPLITVRIPTFNRAEIVCERALASVRRQTYDRWEAVVVGDACTDDTAERIRSIGD